LLTISLVLLGSAVAHAQLVYDPSSTYAEGYQRGLGGVISAQGQRNLSNSQAAINMTDARSNQIDNQVKSVNAYWEKNSIYEQHVQEKLADIDAKRARYEAKHGLQPLTSQQFDRTTGQINWPGVLKQQQYDQYRNKIDAAFKTRAGSGMMTGDDYLASTTAFKDWHAALVKQKNEYPASILDQLLRFLLALQKNLDDNLA
jgi:hypothetical protein